MYAEATLPFVRESGPIVQFLLICIIALLLSCNPSVLLGLSLGKSPLQCQGLAVGSELCRQGFRC